MAARVAATGMVGRRDQANRATVPPAQLAILPRLEAKTRPARSETMAVVRSSQVESHLGRNRLTSDAPYKASSGFTRVTACRIARSPKATFVTRLRPSGLPRRTARQLPAQPTTRWMEPSSTGKPRRLGARRVEDGRGGLGHAATLRFPSPLIKPDVRISRIRLSDWFHLTAHGGDTELVRAAEAAGDGKRAQQHRSASVFAAG